MDTYRQAFNLIMDQKEDEFIQLAQSPDFNNSWKDNNGNSLLIQSIRYGLPKVFNYLMQANVDVSNPNDYGTSPLMWTVKEREYEMFAKIVNTHPDLSVKNQEEETALKMLLDYKDKKIIEQFILSMDNRKSLALVESHLLQTEHSFKDYSIGVIGIAKLQLKLNNSLSDKSTKEIKRKL